MTGSNLLYSHIIHTHREVMDVHVVMSPAQRSIRIAVKFGYSSDGNHGNYHVSSFKYLPEELDFGYLPNKALF